MAHVAAEYVKKDYIIGEVTVQALRGLPLEIEPASFVSFVGL
jgi:hypothetical protein